MSIVPSESSVTPLITLRKVDVCKAGSTVLHAIDWQLLPGEHTGIVGGNGSGKTTLLELLAGQAWPAPERGSRRYDFGAGPLSDAVQARRRIHLLGHELQNRYARNRWNFLALDVVLSGIAQCDIPQRRMNDAQREEARSLLAFVELGHLAGRRFLTLSRGEQRRVLLARALGFRPEILLLDEAASGLDPRSRQALYETVARAGRGLTVVAAAHRMDDLPSAICRVIELDRGRIARVGPRDRSTPPTVGAPADRWPGRRADEPVIELERASVWLGGCQILKRIDWRLERGEHWLITGANGSGKSTLLKLLHGQLRPATGGRIRWPFLGNPRNVWQLRRKIGYVSAEYQADYRYPTTVADCIGSGIESSVGLTRKLTLNESERVDGLLLCFRLEPLRDRLLTTLSYGQMHRVLIARMLVNRPAVLLLDEPWEGLDGDSIDLVTEQLGKAMAAGTQLVCASHTGAAQLPFTAGLVLSAGRISDDDASA